MTKPTTLKLSLLGAFLSLGAIAANDGQTKRMKDNAEFVEKAAMASKTQVSLSELAISQSTNPSVKQFAEKVISDHQKAFDSLKAVSSAKGIPLPFSSIGSGATTSATPGSSDVSDLPEANAPRGADDAVPGDARSPGEDVASAARETGEDVADATKKGADDLAYGAKKTADDVKGDVTGASPTISQSKEFAKAEEKAQEKYNDLTKLSGEKFDKEYLSSITNGNDKAIKLVEKQSKDGWDSDLKSWATETLPTLQEHRDMAKSVKQDLKNARPSM